MRHQKTGRKFGRVRKVRRAFITGLVRSLVIKEKIRTTEARAKEIRPVVEKLVTRAKSDSVANRRQIARVLDPSSTKKIFTEIAPRYSSRKGGYIRITKLDRRGDNAPMAVIEFIK